MSDGLPSSKKCRHVPNAMVSSLTAQELEAMALHQSAQEPGATALDLTAQEFEGSMSEQGGPPYLSPTHRG